MIAASLAAGSTVLFKPASADVLTAWELVQCFYRGGVSKKVLRFMNFNETGFYISRNPVFMEGRIELLQYLQEQAVCDNYHRYGNLGERGLI